MNVAVHSIPAYVEPSGGNAACKAARERLLAVRGDPFLSARWERMVFLHFRIPAGVLRKVIPKPFELELHEGAGCVSLAAVTMTNFRRRREFSTGRMFEIIGRQRFLNLRACVKCQGEPGVLFLYGWLTQPFRLSLPSGMFSLPYSFARIRYDNDGEPVSGEVAGKIGAGRFAYGASPQTGRTFAPCPAGSLAEFAMERYSGFFTRGHHPFVFRAWHPPWLQVPLDVEVTDLSLVAEKFSWFKEASFSEANLTAGFEEVWLGGAHRLPDSGKEEQASHRVISAFYDMP